MPIFNRGPRVIDNSTGQDVTPTTGGKLPRRPGKHEKPSNYCSFTWGTCDTRCNDPEANPDEKKLPHICQNLLPHKLHDCSACGKHQVG